MPRITTIGSCEECSKSFSYDHNPVQTPKRFCSVKCRTKAYKRIPWVRESINRGRRRRRREKLADRDRRRRAVLQELLDAMQKEVPI